MKKTLLIIPITIISIIILAFTSIPPLLKAISIQQNYSKVRSNLYFSRYEISNSEYRLFINDLVNNNQIELLTICRPDTAQWSVLTGVEPFKILYHSAKAYDNYPAVTIPYEGAIHYCEWLTEQYNKDNQRPFKKVVFRLPSEQEWLEAAKGGKEIRTYGFEGPSLVNNAGLSLCNFKHVANDNISYDPITKTYNIINPPSGKTMILSPKISFQPNEFGLYNMSGNAAEMVIENGIAKGGSFNDPGHDVRIESVKRYTQPSPEIGFRPVMEKLER